MLKTKVKRISLLNQFCHKLNKRCKTEETAGGEDIWFTHSREWGEYADVRVFFYFEAAVLKWKKSKDRRIYELLSLDFFHINMNKIKIKPFLFYSFSTVTLSTYNLRELSVSYGHSALESALRPDQLGQKCLSKVV